MMLQIMVYATVMAAAFCVAGLCLERLAALWGLPRRAAWVVALLLSVCWPPLMILGARPQAIATPMHAYSVPTTRIDADMAAFSHAASTSSAPAATLQPAPQPVARWHVAALASDRNLFATWAALSLASILYLIAAQLRLRQRMAAWRPAVLHDQQVLVSETTGPALVGVFRPRLVIPRWLLDEPADTQLLVLEHERQHIAACDPLLIRAVTLLLAAFPWNLPLWWQFRRMRRAIELDCDARVVDTGVAAQRYGEVLLTVVGRATRMPAGVIAMSEPVSALERRIQNLLPDPVKHARLQARAVMLVLALTVGTAFAMHAPAIPKRAAVRIASEIPAAIALTPAPVTPAPAPSITIEATPPSASPPLQIRAMAAAVPAASATEIAQPDSPRFTVRILPKEPGTDPAGEEWNRIQATLAARLRRVPGLALLAPDASSEGTADYELAIRFPDGNPFTIDARSMKAQPAAQPAGGIFNVMPPGAMNFFFSYPRDATQLEKVIDNTVTTLQLRVFPRDPAVEQQLLAQLADPMANPRDRAAALMQLLENTERHFGTGPMSISNGAPPASDALIRAGVAFATSESDPRGRAGTWGQLRETGAPALVPHVVAALDEEPNAQVRLVLIGILERSAGTEPARAALESIARSDQRQLARMAAQRALTGDVAGWNQYVLATLQNTRLGDNQRLEPLTYQEFPDRSPQERLPLDAEGIRALGTLIERAETLTNETSSAINVLIDANSQASREVLHGLLAVREGRQVAFEVRNRLLSSRGAALFPLDDSTRASLQDIVARDPDPRIRETARTVVESAARRESTINSLRQRLQ